MRARLTVRRAATLATVGLGTSLWLGCSDRAPDSLTGPSARPQVRAPDRQEVLAAVAAHRRHSDALLRLPGVVGTAVGLLPNGSVGVKVFLARSEVRGLPTALDRVPVAAQVTGLFMARSDPTTKQRPAPLGFSVGHPAITAGTIGARVRDAANVYVLSNNHVLANSNNASIGDAALQPGPFDGGTANDQIGTLFAFRPIDFSGGDNAFDAAIALSNPNALGNATPSDDGYGAPSATIFGDANNDGFFDNIMALLGLNVQKYGRTTKLTQGQITGVNATVTVCYEVFFIWCVKAARFVDQIIIEPGAFSGGGDSGSLIVTSDPNNNPVGLLFAGSSTQTIANRIDLVLNYFGVTVDGGDAPPPAPVTDVAITGVSAPASVAQGGTANVVVTIRNVGNQPVTPSFDVTLQDETDVLAIGTQAGPNLAPGATATLTFSWNTTSSSLGPHTLRASHNLPDDQASNNQASTTVTVNPPGSAGGMHVGDLDGFASTNGNRWSATVEITVHDATHAPLNGATVVGTWSVGGLNANTCTTGELGGNGTCIVLAPSIRRTRASATFTVTSVTMAGQTYVQGANHDVDGSSNGTSIRVNRP